MSHAEGGGDYEGFLRQEWCYNLCAPWNPDPLSFVLRAGISLENAYPDPRRWNESKIWKKKFWNIFSFNICIVGSSIVYPDYVFKPPGSESVIILYGSGSFHQQAKKVRQTLISTILWLLFDLISMITAVNVSILAATVEKKQDPDPYQNVTDPQHWLGGVFILKKLHFGKKILFSLLSFWRCCDQALYCICLQKCVFFLTCDPGKNARNPVL